MSAQDKVIKISFAVDPSLASAKRAIEDITQAVKDLVKESRNLGKVFGGGGGGGATAIPGQPGTSSNTQIQHQQAGQSAASPLKGLSAGAVGASAGFKSAATSAKLSFKEMAEAFEKMVDANEAQVQRFEKLMGRFTQAAQKGAGGIGGTATGGGGGAAAAAAANGGAAAVQAARVGGGGGARGGGFGGGGGGFGGGAGGGGGATGLFGAGGQGGLIGGQGGLIAGVASRLGLPTGVVGGAAALTTGIGIANAVTGAAYQNQLANVQWQIERPMINADQRASIGQAMGGNAMAIRHGDAARAMAMMDLSKGGPGSFQALHQDRGILQEAERNLINPTTLGGHIAKSGAKTGALAYASAAGGEQLMGFSDNGRAAKRQEMGDKMLDIVRKGYERSHDPRTLKTLQRMEAAQGSFREKNLAEVNPLGSLSGLAVSGVAIGTERTDVLALKTAQAKAVARSVQDDQELLMKRMQEDPMLADRINRQYASANSDAATFRSLGMSGKKIIDKKTGKEYDAGGFMRAKAQDQNRDVGELGSAAQSLASAAGRGFLGNYGAVLGPTTGGLHNAAQILAIGSQFDAGAAHGGWGERGKKGQAGTGAAGFMQGIQGMIGKGGVDVTAGMNVANLGMNAMMSTSFQGTTGAGLMETLLQATSTGSVGGDMRKARELAGGMAVRERQAAGGVDQLNKALNLSAAMQAAPEAPWTVRNTLSSMSDASILDILKSGQVPKVLSDNGVTLDMISKYHSATNMTKFARFGSADEYGTEEQRAAVGRYQAAGGMSYLKGMSKSSRETELNLLAGAESTGMGISLREARSDLDIEASAAGALGKKISGKGAGDPFSKDSTAGKAGSSRATSERNEAEKNAADQEMFLKVFKHMPDMADALDRGRMEALKKVTPGGDLGTAIGGVSEALNHFVEALNTKFGGGGHKPSAPTPAQ